MVLRWVRSAIRSTSPLFSDFYTLVQLPVGVTLKRTICSWYVETPFTDNDSQIYWSQNPIISAIQVTSGSPPPFPINPGRDLPEGDFLHYGISTVKPVPGWTGASGSMFYTSAATTGDIEKIDTDVQRKPIIVPSEVFLTWGFLGPLSLPANGVVTRLTASCLIDEPFETEVASRIENPSAMVD